MSTSPALETAQPVGQDHSSDPKTVQTTSSESQPVAAKQNILEQTAATITDEHNDSSKSQVLPLNVQTELINSSVEANTSIESKVTSTDKENNSQPDLKIPEVNKINSVLEKNIQHVEEDKKEVEETSGSNTTIPSTAETINESTSNDKHKTEAEKKAENAQEVENPPVQTEDPSTVNENNPIQKEPEPENLQQNEETDTSECINIQELTEHVMNILNDEEVVENVMSEQQLLKKNIDLQQFIVKLIHLLKEKTDLCANLDRQNSALISQAKSLKDVIAITKDLLGIRNMEIEHLHADMAAIEESIKEERNRHNLSVQRLNEAMTLNDKLKTEYLTQMDLFQKLREKYNEKVVYLTKENQRLNALLNPDAQAAETNTNEVNDQSNQIESVDK
ncbi:putative leucine-rich repeat-containing protein DDB_G0290503 [Halyomorpha halys]|uniref:putative leucine-rich repeat-containing protein DDB_G0290503 n=1 Tax=Halyomorpha halys TaxID=286706 RepID=UPI0006D4D054|nr:ring-infected erythrocyte surface antigen-like [Halyomorpha halys]